MAIGFIYNGIDYATPDKTLTRDVTPSIIVHQFGDGYEQRAINGINNIQETYSLSFRHRTKAFVDDVASYIDGTNGVTKFTFRYPDTNSTGNEKAVKVVSEKYNINYEYDDYYSLSLTLRRVYEA